MTAVDDLVRWLTEIWDEDEKVAKKAIADSPSALPVVVDNYGYLTVPKSLMLARIAADRKILALHRHTTDPAGWIDCSMCGEQGKALGDSAYAYCEHVRLLASPFASRPGYQESWAVQ